jgi:hypothetical protein
MHREPLISRLDYKIDRIPPLNTIPIASSRNLIDEYLGINSTNLTNREIQDLRPLVYRAIASQSENVRILKVHDAFSLTSKNEALFPPDITQTVVYIIRNPLDVVVSYSNHTDRSLSSIISSMNNPDYTVSSNKRGANAQVSQFFGTWSNHVTSWIDNNQFRVIIVKFEDLVLDNRKIFKDLLIELGIDHNETVFKFALLNSEFSNLQLLEQKNGFVEKPVQSTRFFREGRSDIYRSWLNPNQIKMITGRHSETMKRFGYIH